MEPQATDFAVQYLSPWSGFFKRSMKERQESVQNHDNAMTQLPLNIADMMIENCVGTLSLPLGIAPNFVINQQHFIVPYCVEEPSIIAAASSVSKLIAQNGGFIATNSNRNIMIGQVQILLNITHAQQEKDCLEKAIQILTHNESKYIQHGNQQYCFSMLKRGGGIVKIEPRVITPRSYKHKQQQKRAKYLVVHIHVDVCDAMGANKVNTICEGLSNLFLTDLISNGLKTASIGLRILSNLCTERMTKSSFCIPVSKLSWKGTDGLSVARKMVEAYEFAMDDVYRATTNNKGIMNGMDAVAVALGQDWRAIEAAAHCYASISNENQYGPLAHYYVDYSSSKQCQCLYGYLEAPISVGSKGGSIGTHPGYRYTVNQLLTQQRTNHNDDDKQKRAELSAKDIANVIVSAGLASNFGAMRALAIEGIQKGHMALHSKNIASSVLNDDEVDLVDEVSQFMVLKKAIHADMAKRYMRARRIEFQRTNDEDEEHNLQISTVNTVEDESKESNQQLFANGNSKCYPSTLLVEIPSRNGMVRLDVVVDTTLRHNTRYPQTVHLEMKMNESEHIVLQLNAHNAQDLDLQQVHEFVAKLKQKQKSGKATQSEKEERLYHENMVRVLFGKETQDFVCEYASLRLQELDALAANDVLGAEIKLVILLLNALCQQLVIADKHGHLWMRHVCQAVREYVLKKYYKENTEAFEASLEHAKCWPLEQRQQSHDEHTATKSKALQTEQAEEVQVFAKWLSVSLLRAYAVRTAMLKKENKANRIGEHLWMNELRSLLAIQNKNASAQQK